MNQHPASAASCSGTADGDQEIEGLRESQRMLASLLQNLPGIAFRALIDEQWTMQFMSAGCLQLTGYTADEIIGNKRISYEELTHPDDRAWVREKVLTALAAHRTYDVVYRLVTAQGLERWVWERGQGISGEDGKLMFLEGFLTDVTERQSAEQQVKAQAALLDKARDAILGSDLEGRITYSNQSAQELLGWDTPDIRGGTVDSLFRGSEVQKARDCALLRGEWSGELSARGREGRTLLLESRWTLVYDEQARPSSLLLLNTDVTEKKRLEAQFLRAQRMESIGALAGGIAHDLNNILSPILTSIELIRTCVPNPEDHELVDIVEASANRGADMVKQILVFARGTEGHRTCCELPQIIGELEKIIRETLPREIVVAVETAPDVWPVMGDATQLHQLLLNLCVNARDAMPHGGVLMIRAGNLEEPGVDQRGTGSILLEVSDTGIGIPESIRDKIFDPFFTTKELGEGTGLGLSTVQVIVKNHGGAIRLRSKVGKGTVFGIVLPATKSAERDATVPVSLGLPCGRGELVLVVDDESGVRAVTQRTLENFGYRVLVARNGQEGLMQFNRHREHIDIIVTDVMMPVMDGPTMLHSIRQVAPTLPIIGVTGLVAAEDLNRMRSAGVKTILAKPYTAETLLHTLAGVSVAFAKGG